MTTSDFPELPLEFGIFDWVEETELPQHEIFENRLRYVAAADKGGFYGWHLAEHQGTPLCIDSSPSVLLAAASQRTERIHLAPLTYCLPWYNPFRLYNEICMLDQLSKGRLEVGVGRGTSVIEAKAFGVYGVEDARERYEEALEIFRLACRSEVLNYEGKHFSFNDLEVHNKPYQRPYPPLWYPTSTRASLDYVASNGFSTVVNVGIDEMGSIYQRYREVWLEHRGDADRINGHVAAPRLGRNHHVFIAETDAEADRRGREAWHAWRGRHSYLGRKNNAPSTSNRVIDPDSPSSSAPLIAGSPKTVREKLERSVEACGINYVMCVVSFGSLGIEETLQTIEAMASEVMPALKGTAVSG